MKRYYGKEIKQVLLWTLPRPMGQFSSSIVQGYPTFGVTDVIDGVLDDLKKQNVIVADLSISEYLLQPISVIIEELSKKLRIDGKLELNTFIEDYRRQIDANAKYCIVLRNFDKVLKFKDEKYDQFHYLLDRFQVIGTNTSQYKTVFIVEATKNIESICKSYKYSDFYKIFSYRRQLVRPRSGSDYENMMAEKFGIDFKENYPLLAEEAGGSPGIAVALYEMYQTYDNPSDIDRIERLRPIWDEFMSSMEVNFVDVLTQVHENQVVDSRFESVRRSLISLGLLVERNQKTQLFTHLFGLYLTDAKPEKNKDQSVKVCIRKKKEILPDHLPIFEHLYADYYCLEYTLLQNLPDQAYVFRIDGEDERGQRYRPVILKIHTKQKLEKEITLMKEAASLLGPAVPSVHCTYQKGAYLGASLEFASSDNRNFSSYKFEEFFQRNDSASIASALECLLELLWGIYKNKSHKKDKIRNLLYPPRAEEIDRIEELEMTFSSYHSSDKSFRLADSTLHVPACHTYMQSFTNFYFDSKNEYRTCKVHGDLNLGNFLVDGIGQLHIIDFSTLKEGMRFTDHTRLETEIRFKLSKVDSQDDLREMVFLEDLALNFGGFNFYRSLKQLKLSNNINKQITAIDTIRSKASDVIDQDESVEQVEQEYLICLLTQTLRLALFEDYLNPLQREFAFIYSSLLFRKLGVLNQENPQYQEVIQSKQQKHKKDTYITPLLANLHDGEFKVREIIMCCIGTEERLVRLIEEKRKVEWFPKWRNYIKDDEALIGGSTFRHKRTILSWLKDSVPSHVYDRSKFIRQMDLVINLLEDKILDDRNEAFHATLYSKSEKDLERMLDNTKTLLHILDELTESLTMS